MDIGPRLQGGRPMRETEDAMYPYFCIKHHYVCQLMIRPCPECLEEIE